MYWILFLSLGIFSNSLSNLFQRMLASEEDSNPIAYTIIYQVLTALILCIVVFIHGFHIPNLMPLIIPLAILTIFDSAMNVCMFQSLKYIDASEFTILFSSRSVFAIITAIIFLHEKFSIIQAMGTILIIGSIILVSWKKEKIKFSKGEILAVIAATAWGLKFINEAYIITRMDVLTFSFLDYLLPALTIWAVFPKATKSMRKVLNRKSTFNMLILCFTSAITTLGLFFAYQYGRNAAQISSLSQIATIVTVLLAIIFLRETIGLKKKILAGIICFIGVLLVR